jgi:hypothetical protein
MTSRPEGTAFRLAANPTEEETMTISFRRGSAIALGLFGAALAASAGFASSTTQATQCGVISTTERGMLVLEGAVLSPTALSGEYRFAIQSSSNGGSSNVSQGGYFTANANESTPLGKVMINAGARYSISFDVTANGKKIVCDQAITTQL